MKTNLIRYKIISLAVLFVGTVIGCYAHFNNPWKYASYQYGFYLQCKLEDECPHHTFAMESAFVGMTIFCCIASAFSIFASFIPDDGPRLKKADTAYNGLAGILGLIAGLLLLGSAILVDIYMNDNLGFSMGNLEFEGMRKVLIPRAFPETKGDYRRELKFFEKLAGGVLTLISGIMYCVVTFLIRKS